LAVVPVEFQSTSLVCRFTAAASPGRETTRAAAGALEAADETLADALLVAEEAAVALVAVVEAAAALLGAADVAAAALLVAEDAAVVAGAEEAALDVAAALLLEADDVAVVGLPHAARPKAPAVSAATLRKWRRVTGRMCCFAGSAS